MATKEAASDFDEVTHAEVASMSGSEAQCNRCHLPFQLLRRRHHCRTCQRAYCDDCCHKHPEEGMQDRICHGCLDKVLKDKTDAQRAVIQAQADAIEREERDKRLRKQIDDLAIREASSRIEVVTEEGDAFSPFAKAERKDRKLVAATVLKREQEEAERSKAEVRNATLDKWAAEKGARCGAVTLTIVRATNVQPAQMKLHCSPYVVVKYGTNELRSQAFHHEPNPEFDFVSYFLIDNDQEPVLVTLMDDAFVTPVFLGNLTVNLRRPIPNLVKEVSDAGVLIEKASVLQAMYDEKGVKVPDTQVFVKWAFEVRETNTHVFCPTCGRVDSRCTCTSEEREQRFKAESEARLEKERDIVKETTRRLEAEAQKRKEKEEFEAKKREREEKERAEQERREKENQRLREEELARRREGRPSEKVERTDLPPPPAADESTESQAVEPSASNASGPVLVESAPPPKQESGGCCIVQ